jgi:uncharacterized protein YPO0396
MATTTQSNVGERKMDQSREQFAQSKENLKDAATLAQQAGVNAAQGIGQRAQEMASGLGTMAQETAANLGQKAQEMASSAHGKTDEALSTVGERVRTLAGSIRPTAPHDGIVGATTTALADRLDSTGRYLQEHGIKDIRNDLGNIVKSHPIPSLMAVFGVGFLAGMAARR